MVRYRRNRVPGGIFFITVTLRNRKSDLLVARIDALREAWRSARVRVPHEVIAAVVLPEHLHAHIIPRWAGDTNFITAVGQVRVIPSALEQMHETCIEAATALKL